MLEILCTSFNFQKGFVYQVNNLNTFSLRESFGNPDKALLARFSWTKLSPEVQHFINSNAFFQIHDKDTASEIELAILNGLGVHGLGLDSLVLVPFFDNKAKIIGLIGLADRSEKTLLDEEELDTIKFILNLISKDVSIREYQKRELRAAKAVENILDNMGIDVYVNELETHEMLYANKSMAAPYGGYKHFENKKCWQALYDDKTKECDFCPRKKIIDENGKPSNVYSWDYQRPFDGSWFRVFSSAFRWIDGRTAQVVTSVDITENKRNEAIIKQMSEHDDLTGLPNRRKLIVDLQDFMNKAKSAPEPSEGYLMFLDLDGFKIVNDTFGHSSGDELLVKISSFLENMPELKDKVYRQSGDEFIIFIPNISKNKITQIAQKILHQTLIPWKLQKGTANCEVSIGIAHYPTDGDNPETLIQTADAAMYTVKHRGKKGISFADNAMKIII